MSYTITESKGREAFNINAGTLTQARTTAQEIVTRHMEAFSDDREALKDYGYIAAEDWAIDLPEHGGECTLADGWTIEVVNNDDMEVAS